MPDSDAQSLLKAIENVDKSTVSNAERKELIVAAGKLQAKMENPWDTLMRLAWINPTQASSLKTLVDLKFFEKWVSSGGGKKTVDELAEMVNCGADLLERLLRVISTTHLLSNPGPHEYAMTDFSESLADRTQYAAINYWFDLHFPVFGGLPQFLSFCDYKTPPGGPSNSGFNWALNQRGTLFDYWAGRPQQEADFAHISKGYANSMTPWIEFYPSEDIVKNSNSKDVLLVDIGGSKGHDIMHFQRKHSPQQGQLVLQDLQGVIKEAVVDSKVEAVAHDFFTSQPIKGAHAYYLHSILHDWPDNKAIDILKNIVPAMEKGKSRILLHEIVLQPTGNSAQAAQSDLVMMAVLNARERTEEMWKELVSKAGLKVTKIFSNPTDPFSVLELELI